MPWKLEKIPTGAKPAKPAKPARPAKPAAPAGYRYRWREQ